MFRLLASCSAVLALTLGSSAAQTQETPPIPLASDTSQQVQQPIVQTDENGEDIPVAMIATGPAPTTPQNQNQSIQPPLPPVAAQHEEPRIETPATENDGE